MLCYTRNAMKTRIHLLLLLLSISLLQAYAGEGDPDKTSFVKTQDLNIDNISCVSSDSIEIASCADIEIISNELSGDYIPGDRFSKDGKLQIETIYAYTEGNTLSFQHPDWKRIWINSAVLTGAFVSSLVVLECLPEDATSWNRAELRNTPFYKRWYNHVFKDGFEWDSDNPIFNLVLHPYAGAAYFMAARSCGLSFWGSLLYSACISTIGWEFGIEAVNERPSIQDIFITPLVGSAIGEGFYRLKRYIVSHDYHLFGSSVIGNIIAFLIDPVNEVVGLFAGNPARRYAKEPRLLLTSAPTFTSRSCGFTISMEF